MSDFANNLFQRFGSFARYVVVRRQLSEIARLIDTLSTSERRTLVTHAAREIELSSKESREASTTNAGFIRARSENSKVRIIGISQWIASAFRETEFSPHNEMQDLHRQIMRLMRLLKENTVAGSRAA